MSCVYEFIMSLYNYLKIHAVLCPLVILAMLQLKEELDSTKELSNNSSECDDSQYGKTSTAFWFIFHEN